MVCATGAAVPARTALTGWLRHRKLRYRRLRSAGQARGHCNTGRSRHGQEQIKTTANVADTVRPAVAGAKDSRDGMHCAPSRAGSPRRCCPTTTSSWPTRCGRRGSCAGRVLEVRRETEDSATWSSSPAGASLRLSGRPVHRHRSARRRTLAVAVVLADVGPDHHRCPSKVRAPSPSRSRPCPRGSCRLTWSAGWQPGTIVRLAAPQGNFVMPDPAPA